ncbi:MAG: type II secretion system ATPase GspE [Deltaproteobacteria bacterium]|nr:type II secretion system ATPase GspE [Deltaproteobacteria bacterium]
MAIRRLSIEEGFLQHGVDPAILREVRTQAEREGQSLTEALADSEKVAPEALARILSDLSGIPLLSAIDPDRLDPDLVRVIPLALAREKGVLPLWAEEDGTMLVAIADLSAVNTLDDLRVLIGRRCRPILVPRNVLQTATNTAWDRASRTASAVMEEIREETEAQADDDLTLDADLLDDPNQAPIIRFVNSLLTQAIKDRASDIHIEPFEKELVVRFRIDGVLYEIVKPPPRLQASIVSRVKIMAGLNIAEKRIPQDGRIRTRMAGREIDLRVSTLPVRHGERVVMRILEKGTVFNLEQVGMGPDTLQSFRKMIRLPHGILLVTGPTGSGKTTTLYSALSEINEPDKNILTIEDPIEYELRGIGQTQVNPKIDLTFASTLRAHLRQDPDIILVGEIRDRETADNAVQASLTGHLVFSTLHTNDAPTAFSRLVDMGVEPFLVSSSLIAVLAQRLVRRLCRECREAYRPSEEDLRHLGLGPASVDALVRSMEAGGALYRARGCPTCLGTGYQGRSGIYELLVVNDDIRTMVTAQANAGQVRQVAVANGMATLRDDGIRKVLEGVTSLDEVVRVTQEEVLALE